MSTLFQVQILPLAAHTTTAGAASEHRPGNQRETHRSDLFLCRLMWSFFFILNSLSAAWRGYPGAAFWAKEHLEDAEQHLWRAYLWLFSQSHKGTSIVCSVGHENRRQHLWSTIFPKKLSYPGPSTSETCSLQSLTSLLWVTLNPPLALPPCALFRGPGNCFPCLYFSPPPMTAWSPDPFPAPSSSITKNPSIATGGSCFYIW